MIKKEYSLTGYSVSLETQNWAKQAQGSVVYRVGKKVMILATACAAKEANPSADFFPLTVDYREKFYSFGKFPGGFFKRENRASENEVLTSRLVDRPIRPLFPEGFFNETQVLLNVLSYDGETNLQPHAINAASAALCVSSIPFAGPVAAVSVGRVNGELIVNPTREQMAYSDLDLLVAGSMEAVVMTEGEAQELPPADFLAALKFAHEEIKKVLQAQDDFVAEVKPVKSEPELRLRDQELIDEVMDAFRAKMEAANQTSGKHERQTAIDTVKKEAKAQFLNEDEEDKERERDVKHALEELEVEIVRNQIFEKKTRADGRRLDEIRDINIELDVLPGAHGSSVFTRGETQSLGVLTLGTAQDSQRYDTLMGQGEKRFMLHYNFPPFSVGEVKRMGPPGRREIGHGNLAERSLKAVIPDLDDFPYTVRLVSEILESNGSSSMATVCSGSMAMMAGGVPITGPVAGIAMGLITKGDDFAVLSDIAGLEDHFGDMDFKMAGTRKGITAFQLDVKLEGISFDIIEKAIQQADEGRAWILSKMDDAIKNPRSGVAQHAPRVLKLQVDSERLGELIGPGGKVIRGIIDKTGTNIDIEDDGTVTIFANDTDAAAHAKELVETVFREARVGEVYVGKVTRVTDFGAFVEYLPGKEGLCHISKLDSRRVGKVTDVVKEGEEIEVMCVGIDRQGRVDLSRKDAMAEKSKRTVRVDA